MRKNIVVVGPTLLDVIGVPAVSKDKAVDRAGSVSISVGGVAVNLAANLVALGHDVQLVSFFRRGSDVARLLKDRVIASGIRLDYCVDSLDATTSSFLGVLEEGDLFVAITDCRSEEIALSEWGDITGALAAADLVIAETNLSISQLQFLAEKCAVASADLCLVCASDSKAERITFPHHRALSLVTMNNEEARAAGYDLAADEPSLVLCERLNAERVLITCGAGGAILHQGDARAFIQAPDGPVLSTTGAGDALAAAVCVCILDTVDPGSHQAQEFICRTVGKVLGSPFSSLAASALFLA